MKISNVWVLLIVSIIVFTGCGSKISNVKVNQSMVKKYLDLILKKIVMHQ